MTRNIAPINNTENHPLSKYYQFQSRIYDMTRWSFLFGRRQLIRTLPIPTKKSISILEIGCGTGKNLVQLAKKYPHAEITGIDLSEEMLQICRKKITPYQGRISTIKGAFGEVTFRENFDLIVFSYCLTMVNPGWDRLIDQAKSTLKTGGVMAVVDFHDTAVSGFEHHMAGHHVRMDGHLLNVLPKKFRQHEQQIAKAYFGAWRWFMFIGYKKP